MIETPLFNRCDDCGRKIKGFHFYKTRALCSVCYRKQFTIIPSTMLLNEPIRCKVLFSLELTRTQEKLLDERINYLFPNLKRCKSKYLRALILGDILNWKDHGNNKEDKN